MTFGSVTPLNAFRAAPIIDNQLFVTIDEPQLPPSYELMQVGSYWLASDQKLRRNVVYDSLRRNIGTLVGHTYSEFHGEFLFGDEVEVPVEVGSADDLERHVLPRLSGIYVFITAGALPSRIYLDHGGSLPVVYSAADRRAASSAALLLDEAAYQERFQQELHAALVEREGYGGWIPGTLTAHRDVYRVLPNHYLDLGSWKIQRYWPKQDDFRQWRDFEAGVSRAAKALDDFSAAAIRAFDVAVTLTAGSDSRLVLASCRASIDECEFFTLQAPNADMDVDISGDIARRFGLSHRAMPLRQATVEEVAIWDRMVGDCVIEAPRQTHVTLRDLTEHNAMFTGVYGEVGRCRLYRQDFDRINRQAIDANFVMNRLTLPANARVLEDIDVWLAGLTGQPNSVILDLAYLELRAGSWAMSQRPLTNSIKLNFLPFTQRAVFDTFIGVSPAAKGTSRLFPALVDQLWPELGAIPINKYGDIRDYLVLWKKVRTPNRVRRFLRDRLARRALATN